MASIISILYDGQANADKRLATAATMTAYLALPTAPDSIVAGHGDTIDVWLGNSTAAQGGTLCVMESTTDPATGATVIFVKERKIKATDLVFDPSDSAWGLAVGDINSKAQIRVSITKGSLVTMFMSASDGGAWYARYHAYAGGGELAVDRSDLESNLGNVGLLDKTEAEIDPATEDKQDDQITLLTGTAADTARTTNTKVIPVQGVDAAGVLANNATANAAYAAFAAAGAGAYFRQDSTATIAKETGGNLTSIVTALTTGGLPVSGFEATGDDDNAYNTIVTAPAWECHNLHVAVGNGGVRVSLNGGTAVHFYVPANTERQFPGQKIPAGAVIKTKKFVDGGTVSTNTAISVW